VDLAASKMSREEALKFKEDFERLQFDKQMKAPPQPGRA
jgi:hypothetical protein